MAAPRGTAVRRTGQVLTGLGALVVLCAVLAGGPVALIALAGNPLPDHVPTLAEIGTTLTSRDDGQLFLRALAVVGWFGWATFAFSVVVELFAQIFRRRAPRLPGMRHQQRAAAALVGSIALIIAASPAATAATTLAGPYPTAAAPVTHQVTIAQPATLAQQPTAAQQAGLTRQAETEPAVNPVYRVAKGDYLGTVAERYLDDFGDYREVAKLNRLKNPDRIRPGQLLKLPTEADDAGARAHANGRLVARPASPAPPGHDTPATSPVPDAGNPGGPGVAPPPPPADMPVPEPPTSQKSSGTPPVMAVGASRAGDGDGVNRPLAVSAVLTVASIVGAQIGAVLGLRRRQAAPRAAARPGILPGGRHRRD
ncbi:peptidoglycan-binding protein [Micromonospora rosaria]|uniref:Peptidoglycan-binding protein n=1 Tax=Micromonospora rosaria TaxID=47874 RepID=A0A136PWV0_9ACTN|nr:LysM domain-containing protein [Micromonospora rosaria]KXK62902.1 peptidoglycan-binding protein [Micromonospora rosaria]